MAFLALLRANRKAVDKMVDYGARKELLRLLREANEDLRERLKSRNVRGATKLAVAQMQVARAEIADAVRRVEGKVRDHLTSKSLGLGRLGIRHAVETVQMGEKHFRGVTFELPVERALKMNHRLTGSRATLMRQHEASVARYGKHMIREFERQMRLGIVTGQTQDAIVDRLVAHGGPEGLFVEKRWWAERVVRTELMYSYNDAQQVGIEEQALEFRDMRRIILAHFDRRTAMDSVFVHGQIVRVDEPFVDGDGRVYMLPPARPNDREIVQPYRLAWPVPETWMPRPKAERVAAAGGREELTPEQAAVLKATRRRPSEAIPHVSADDVRDFMAR